MENETKAITSQEAVVLLDKETDGVVTAAHLQRLSPVT